MSALALSGHVIKGWYVNEPRADSTLEGFDYYKEIIESMNEARFYDMAWMQRSTFMHLIFVLEETGKLNSTSYLNGIHVPACIPNEESGSFRNRKGLTSQNGLGVCDFDMKFTYVIAGWDGCAHDGRVLNDAIATGLPIIDGKYYLANAGYRLTSYTLTSYCGVRYHLKECQAGRLRPQSKEELYNLRHSSTCDVIEHAYGIVKQKFPILKSMRPYTFDRQVDIVFAAFTLHNFIRICNEPMGPLDHIPYEQPTNTVNVSNMTLLPDNEEAKTVRDCIAKQM